MTKDAKANTHNFKTVNDKKSKVASNLTSETIKRFENYKNMSDNMRYYQDDHLNIDEGTKRYLRNELAIDVNSIVAPSQKTLYTRPMSS